MKQSKKIISFLLGTTMLFSTFVMTSCANTPAPEINYNVYSVKILCDGQVVNGQYSVDLSLGTVQLTAQVDKDAQADGTVTFTSSNTDIAEINSNGLVTLKSVGETVITATVGDESCYVVIVVKGQVEAGINYTITVSGGIAKNEKGETITSAAVGEYVTLVPSMPEHKDFVKWDFNTETNLWKNGHVFRMPSESLIINAEYVDKLYELTMIGGTVVKANGNVNPEGEFAGGTSVETQKLNYKFTYGTEIVVKANDTNASRMFVGWDLDELNNRVGEEGVSTYSFEMIGGEMKLTAIYSDVIGNILPGANATSDFTGTGLSDVTYKKIVAGVVEGASTSDADLESLYGYSLKIPANHMELTSSPENIQKSDLNTMDDYEPKTVKIIFKNSGDYDITVELGYSYFGNYGSTGVVTIGAHEVVTKVFNANIGLNDCSWSFAIRETMKGPASETVQLDIVAAAAKTYPSGYPLLQKRDAQYLNFDKALTLYSGWGSTGRRTCNNNLGAQLFVSRANQVKDTKAIANAKVTNMPAYSSENTTTSIYVQVVNLVNQSETPYNKFTIVFTDGITITEEKTLGSAVVNITKPNELLLLKIDVNRSSSEEAIYMHYVKEKETNETGNMNYNVFAQFSYNNVFGYEE